MSTYNGWTNYATWRINLEIFDGFDPTDYFSVLDRDDVGGLASSLEDYADQILFECGECDENSLAGSYARAFLSDVNWYEIAEHLIEMYPEEIEDEEESE